VQIERDSFPRYYADFASLTVLLNPPTHAQTDMESIIHVYELSTTMNWLVLDEDEERQIGTKITYKIKKKVFCYNWLEKEKFKHWLAPVKENKNLCKCICCNKSLTCGKTELQKHEKSLIHQKNSKLTKSTQKLNVLFGKAIKEKTEQMKKEKRIKTLK